MTGGPFAQATGLDNIPLDNLGGTADLGADATDNSADVNVNGANDVAANAAAEAQEIAAVPDPQSPAGQAAIMAIIEKYHGKSAGTVEGSAATEQANGAQAADGGSSDKDNDDDHAQQRRGRHGRRNQPDGHPRVTAGRRRLRHVRDEPDGPARHEPVRAAGR